MLIDSRRLDAGNIFVPVKESSELSLACVTEGGNPKPTLTWEVLLSPGVERHAQKVAAELLELQEFRSDKVCTIFYIIISYTHYIRAVILPLVFGYLFSCILATVSV